MSWQAGITYQPGLPPYSPVLHMHTKYTILLLDSTPCRLGGLGWQPFAGSGAAGPSAAAAAPLQLPLGLLDGGVRTTRNMERQLLGHLAGGSSQPQQQQQQRDGGEHPGVRHSGRAARQLRDLSELMDEDGGEEVTDGDDSPVPGGRQQGRVAAATAATAAAAAAAADDEDDEHMEDGVAAADGLLVCGFSRDGTHIVAGGNDCSVYIWQWAVPQPASLQQQQQQQGGSTPAGPPAASPAAQAGPSQDAGAAAEPASAGEPTAAAAAAPAADGTSPGGAGAATDQPSPAAAQRAQQVQQPQRRQQRQGGVGEGCEWPAPREVCQLKGHRNDVVLLQFSHGGDQAATGSKDGTVRVGGRAGVLLLMGGRLVRLQWEAAASLVPGFEAFTGQPGIWRARPAPHPARCVRRPAGVAPAAAVAQAAAGMGAGGDVCCAARPGGDQGGAAAAAPAAGAEHRPDCLECRRPAVRAWAGWKKRSGHGWGRLGLPGWFCFFSGGEEGAGRQRCRTGAPSTC